MDPRYNSSILKLAGREEIILVWVSFIFTVAPLQLDQLKSQTFFPSGLVVFPFRSS